MRNVAQFADARENCSSVSSEKARKRAWSRRRFSLPRRGRRGYYRCAERLIEQNYISPGIHAGVCVPFTLVSSPVHEASRCSNFPTTIDKRRQ